MPDGNLPNDDQVQMLIHSLNILEQMYIILEQRTETIYQKTLQQETVINQLTAKNKIMTTAIATALLEWASSSDADFENAIATRMAQQLKSGV